MNPQVQRNSALSRFEVTIDGATAIAEYYYRGNSMVLPHTLVPSALRGRGLAGMLVEAALQAARAERRKVEPQCDFAATFIARHPEYGDLL